MDKNNTLFALIGSAQRREDAATMALVERFRPLLLKYAVALYYEDALADLTEKFLWLIYTMKLAEIRERGDGAMVSYISVSIKREYIRLSKRNRKRAGESPLSIATGSEYSYEDAWERLAYEEDRYPLEDELYFPPSLTDYERDILYQLYVRQARVKDLAKRHGVSSPAISCAKQNAIRKLKQHFHIDEEVHL